MPSVLSSSPFLSLRADASCGRHSSLNPSTDNNSNKPFSSLSANGHIDGEDHTPHPYGTTTNNSSHHPDSNSNHHPEDEFLRLSKPQQDVLLLHGPRQRYSLEKAQDIPELRSDREILIQVLAIGLNPVDWKGADYGFGQPSYPWVNGRDFAGIVVRAPKLASKIKTGDVVCGPSTDYRDVRKGTYQEYLVTTDYNVARVPAETTVKVGAAVGVAFVAAAVSLGVSLGVDFTRLADAPPGPDLYNLIRTVNPRNIPQDVKAECLESVSEAERPQPGDWLAIWGASSATAILVLQIAKRAGLRVVCIADAAKHGSRLYDLGADILVDRIDESRAVSIVKSVTGGKLRFAVDASSKESAQLLQSTLAPSGAHLLGLAGLPKEKAPGVTHHAMPIKIFHDVPLVGEAIMAWLEELFLAKTLTFPHIEVADGGLAGVNAALDRLRSGEIGAKRIVVPVGDLQNSAKSGAASPRPGSASTPVQDPKLAPMLDDLVEGAAEEKTYPELAYADALNADPDRLKFAYWVPNVSGGLVISKIPQATKWDYTSNKRYARTAERVGFEYALTQIRFMAGYGAENQHESVTFSQAILHATRRLKVIAAILPGPWNPTVAAKQLASIDQYSNGRVAVNVVFGWFKAEFTSIGQWWLDHSERYRRGREFIECLRGIWTQDKFSYKGDFYQFHDYPLKPKPKSWPGRPHPEIFQGGNSADARDNAAHVSDFYFMNGNTLEGFQSQIADVKKRAKEAGREGQVKFAVNAFVIARESEVEAVRVLREIQGKADAEAVEGFRAQVQNAGAASKEGKGMWADSKFEDLVQYNDGFKTKLIGTPAQIAERICLLKSLGISVLLCAFLNYDTEIREFGETVLPLVRRLEGEGRGQDEGFEVERTGWVYRERPKEGVATGDGK